MISVYVANTDCLSDKQIFDELYHSLMPERQQKIDRLRFEKDKELSLGAGVLLKKALLISGRNYDETLFTADSFGKPHAADKSFLFNISHSGNQVMCVVCDNADISSGCSANDIVCTCVGCDVEEIQRNQQQDSQMGIARRFFDAREYEYLEKLTETEERAKEFCRLWTLKESFIKAIGRGMDIPLNSFYINTLNNGVSVEQNLSSDCFAFREYFADEYRYSICVGYRLRTDKKTEDRKECENAAVKTCKPDIPEAKMISLI